MSGAPQQGAWARVRLVSGQSALGIWEVTAAVNDARIAVGSDPSAQWPVQGFGIAPAHFQLYWDGNALWVSAGTGGSVMLDGAPIDDWRQLNGACRIAFGGGAMDVETVPGAGVDAVLENTLAAAGSDLATDDARTVLYDGDPGMAAAGLGARSSAPPPLPPRASSIPPPLPAAAQPQAPVAPRPAFGTGHLPAPAPPTAKPPGNTRTIIVEEAKSLISRVAAPFRGRSSSHHQAAALDPEQTPHMPRAAGSPFARPDFSQDIRAQKWHDRIPRPNQAQGILLLVIGLAGIVSLAMWGQRVQQAEYRALVQKAAQQKVEQERVQKAAATRAEGFRAAIEAGELAIQKQVEQFIGIRNLQLTQIRAREEAEAALRGRPVDPTVEMQFVTKERSDMEKEGAKLLRKGRYSKALVHYSVLAAVHKDEPAFKAMVQVLKAKLRCRGGRLPTGEPCG